MALRVGPGGPQRERDSALVPAVVQTAVGAGARTRESERVLAWATVSAFPQCVERPTQNWYGQGESDCLIKTKHCDGAHAC